MGKILNGQTRQNRAVLHSHHLPLKPGREKISHPICMDQNRRKS